MSTLPTIALSIRQPWAWMIATGAKNIENRDWPTRFRGDFLIHASKTMTRADYEAARLFVAGMTWGDEVLDGLPAFSDLERGGIVGQARLIDCVASHHSEWFQGLYGFVLEKAKVLPFAPCAGRLGFFYVSSFAEVRT